MSSKKFALGIAVISIGGVLWAKRQEKPSPPADSFTATQIEAFYKGEDPIVAVTRTSTVSVLVGPFASRFLVLPRSPSYRAQPQSSMELTHACVTDSIKIRRAEDRRYTGLNQPALL
jgi:hypothetical protein